jgi:hypothetical protein
MTCPFRSRVRLVGRLVLLLRDDGLDASFAQVGAVGAGGVRLVVSHRVGAGAGTAGPAADPDLGQDRDELGAVGGLSRGEREGQWATAAVGCHVDHAGQPAA